MSKENKKCTNLKHNFCTDSNDSNNYQNDSEIQTQKKPEENQGLSSQQITAADLPDTDTAKRGKNLTEQEIRHAYFKLKRSGIDPTLTNLHDMIGRGSMTTINKVRKKINKELLDEAVKLKENNISREEINELAVRIAALAYTANAQMLKEELGKMNQRMRSEEKLRDDNVNQLCAKYDKLEEEKNALEDEKQQLLADKVKLQARVSELTAELEAAKQTQVMLQPYQDQIKKQSEELKEALAELKQKLNSKPESKD